MPKRKHRRLPNGFGSISKLSGQRRRPYVVRSPATFRLTSDRKDGHHKEQIIGYAKTYNEAYQMLMDFHNNPYDADKRNITFGEVVNYWKDDDDYLATTENGLKFPITTFLSDIIAS